MSNDSKDFFFNNKVDYYYRYRISSIEKTKKDFNDLCNFIILNGKKIFMNIEKKDAVIILRKIVRLKKQYNKYADKIIKKEGINNNEDYSRIIENLMLVANEAILFCEENIILKKGICLRDKYKFGGHEVKLKNIIAKLKNIPYYINVDEPVNVLIDKFQFPIILIMSFIIAFFLLLFLEDLTLGIRNYVNSLYDMWFSKIGYLGVIPSNYDYLDWFIVLFSCSTGLFYFFKLKLSKGYRLSEVKSKVYSRNKNLIYKPFKNNTKILKYGFDAIKYILGFIFSNKSLK